MAPWKTIVLYNQVVFHFHVSSREGRTTISLRSFFPPLKLLKPTAEAMFASCSVKQLLKPSPEALAVNSSQAVQSCPGLQKSRSWTDAAMTKPLQIAGCVMLSSVDKITQAKRAFKAFSCVGVCSGNYAIVYIYTIYMYLHRTRCKCNI